MHGSGTLRFAYEIHDRLEPRRGNGYGDIFAYVERVSGLSPARVSHFFATGMLINVIASMNLHESAEPWAQRLLAGCKEDS